MRKRRFLNKVEFKIERELVFLVVEKFIQLNFATVKKITSMFLTAC